MNLMTPLDVEREAKIPRATQAQWRWNNRYGFGDLALKAGRSVRYRREEFERWLEAQKNAELR
ncbi:helix-turn-helix domain-containing protein [Pseudomonas brassicacearum]|uniref:helix-turn-helix domain-containing protein n=1 Tax=Pseudomonas brassicacearum TaxID=930166 RepID=UPI0011CD85FD|nr:helix-turn-helix domain-containing protein [Pseudomonas brassicacearum]